MSDKLRIGYALGGGGARGLAHIGVLKALEDNDIYPDFIAGTSIGALVGALYASGLSARDIEQISFSLDWRKVASLADMVIPVSGLIQGRKVVALLESYIGHIDFKDLRIPCSCVAADIMNGQKVVINTGKVIDAVRASISIPGIFTPYKHQQRVLVDGGIVSEVPVSVCRAMGAQLVIGVNVIPDPAKAIHISLLNRGSQDVQPGKQGKPGGDPESDLPRLIDVMTQMLLISGYRVAVEDLKAADVAITPPVEVIGFWQYFRSSEAILQGELATREAVPTILQAIKNAGQHSHLESA
jgi:NTE family protein